MSDVERIFMAWLEMQGYQVLRKGWPDFVAQRGSEVRFIELKTNKPNSILSKEQRQMFRALKTVGVQVEIIEVDPRGVFELAIQGHTFYPMPLQEMEFYDAGGPDV